MIDEEVFEFVKYDMATLRYVQNRLVERGYYILKNTITTESDIIHRSKKIQIVITFKTIFLGKKTILNPPSWIKKIEEMDKVNFKTIEIIEQWKETSD